MFRKYAVAEVLSAEMVMPGQRSLKRQAHRAAFTYEPREGYLYVRSRAISSRCNDNFDEFPASEIKKAYKTFVGKPVFVNHNNDNHRRARGVVIDAALHEDTNPDGTPDTWCEVLMEVDAVRFPKLAKAILAGHVDRTSMGTDVAYSLCSVCGNKATTPLEYCQHIPGMKGKRVYRTTASGRKEGILVREICHGLKFFENSLLVEEPADPTAFFLGVEAGPGVKTASKQIVVSGGVYGEYEPTRKHAAGRWSEERHPEPIVHMIGRRPPRPLMAGDHLMNPESGYSAEIVAHTPSLFMLNDRRTPVHRAPMEGDLRNTLIGETAEDRADLENKMNVGTPEEQEFLRTNPEGVRDFNKRAAYDLEFDPEEDDKPAPPKFNVGDRVLSHRGEGATVHRVYPSAQVGKSHRVQVRWDDPDRNLTWDGQEHPEGAGDQTAYYEHVFKHHPDSYAAAEQRVNDAFKGMPDMSRFYSKTAAAEDQHRVPEGLRNAGQEVFRQSLLHGHEPIALSDGHSLDIACNRCGESTSLRSGRSPEGSLHRTPCAYNPASPTFQDGRPPMGDIGQTAPFRDYVHRSLNTRHTALPGGGGGASKRKTTNTCKVCGGPIFKLEGAAGAAHAWQHDDPAGAGMPHHAEPNTEIEARGSLDIATFFRRRMHRSSARWGQFDDDDDHWGEPQRPGPDEPPSMDPAIRRKEPWQCAECGARDHHTGQHDFGEPSDKPGSANEHVAYVGDGIYCKNCVENGKVTHLDRNPSQRDAGKVSWRELRVKAPHGTTCDHCMHEIVPPRQHTEDECEYGDDCEDLDPEYGEGHLHPQDPENATWGTDEDRENVDRDTKFWQIAGPEEARQRDEAHQRATENAHNVLNEIGSPEERHFLRGNPHGPTHLSSLDILTFFKEAYGETVAPSDVDTLRDAECPVCGEADAFDGNQCQVCGYVAPPAMFQDPDLDKAKQLDLRKDVLDDAQVDPNGDGVPDEVPGSAVPGTDQVPGQTVGDTGLPDQMEPDPMGQDDASGQFGDQEGLNPEGEDGGQAEADTAATTLICPACQFEAPSAQPQSVNMADPTAPPADSMEAGQGGDGLMEGDVCPNCGQGQMIPLIDAEQQAQAAPVQDPNSPPQGVKGNTASLDGRGRTAQKGQSMGDKQQQKQAPRNALFAALAAQQAVIEQQGAYIRNLARENRIVASQLAFVAKLAGVSEHVASIRSHADVNNPAEPIPDPPSQPAYETTEQAVTPEAQDNVQNPGMTPGSVQKLPADATTTPMVPGTTLDSGPFNQLLDVTAPVAGTETQLPLEQTKIEHDIRVGDPMNPQVAYPWTIGQSAAAAEDEPQPVMGEREQVTASQANRTMAAMHLARLRIEAGIAAGDDLAVGAQIEASSMPTEAILHEVNVLGAVSKAASRRPQNVGRPAGRPGNLVPRTASAGVQRTMPSMTGTTTYTDPVMAHVASSSESDTADSDLFD